MSLELDGQLLLVGAGKMGGALLSGMLERGLKPSHVLIQDPAPPSDIKDMLSRFGLSAQATPVCRNRSCSVIIIAVKPQLIATVLPDVAAGYAGPATLVVSIAAGVRLSSLEEHLGEATAIVRAMPNTPASIGRGMSVCCSNSCVEPHQRTLCDTLLGSVGATAWVEDEGLMDPVTAVSGSGPAYVFLLAECLARAGQKAGLEEKLAAKLAIETISGAGALLKASQFSPATLRENVTSPGGTTAAALEVLMADEDGFKTLVEKAVAAATRRSRELSQSG